jgi:2,3-diketo-5-methylthio-1-phosphopentane phosphatase
MMAPWKRVGTVGILIHRSGQVLVRSKVPKGNFQRPPFFELEGMEPEERAKEGLKELGFGLEGLRSLEMKLVYYAKEVRNDEHLFAVQVPPGRKAPKGYRWVAPMYAFKEFLLSGHKRGMVKLFPEVHPHGVQALDHVPVEHPSGVVVLCDFDGTVSETEASLAILRNFIPGLWERYERPWLDREISTHDCLGYQFTMMSTPIEEMARFAADNVALRKGFKRFVTWCRKEGHGLVITSSGVDFYIKAILDRNGLGDVPFVANRTHWVDGLGNITEEGLHNAECDWCGNCKLELIELYRSRGAKVVYVGDGATDECPAAKADLVFARSALLEFCKREKVDHIPFDTFDDVRKGLEKGTGK